MKSFAERDLLSLRSIEIVLRELQTSLGVIDHVAVKESARPLQSLPVSGDIVDPAQDLENLVHVAEVGSPLLYLAEYVPKERHAPGKYSSDVVFNRCAAEISRNGNPQLAEIGTPQLGRNTPMVAGVLVAELGAQQKMSIRHRAGHWTGDSE